MSGLKGAQLQFCSADPNFLYSEQCFHGYFLFSYSAFYRMLKYNINNKICRKQSFRTPKKLFNCAKIMKYNIFARHALN